MESATKPLNLRTHRATAWFALFAFAAYLIVLPIHLATVAHCHQPKVHPPSECCDHQHESSSKEHEHQHEHHSADEHMLNAVKHGHSLVAVDFVWTGGVAVAPVRSVEILSGLSVLISDLSSESPPSTGSRAPPCA
jgi:hypothetical protein